MEIPVFYSMSLKLRTISGQLIALDKAVYYWWS